MANVNQKSQLRHHAGIYHTNTESQTCHGNDQVIWTGRKGYLKLKLLIVERVVPKTMENTRVLKASWTTQCFSSFLPYLMITRSKFIGHQLLMWRDKDYHSLKEVVRPHQIITAKLSESKTFPRIFILFLFFFFFFKGKWSTFSPPQIIKSFWKSIKNDYLYI